MSVYESLLAAGCEIEKGSGSDLYAVATIEAMSIIKASHVQYLYFWDAGQQWVEIPFAWAPYWAEKCEASQGAFAPCMASVIGGAS